MAQLVWRTGQHSVLERGYDGSRSKRSLLSGADASILSCQSSGVIQDASMRKVKNQGPEARPAECERERKEGGGMSYSCAVNR